MAALVLLIAQFENLATGMFRDIYSRAGEDSRSGVEELFFLDFINSPETDWIFGRGMDGSYLQEVRNEETGEVSDTRSGIETGYLDMVLKGGLVYDLVIILFMFYALRRTFVRENNSEIKYLGVILLTYFIDMYTTNPVNLYSPRSIIFWFIVSVLIQHKKVVESVEQHRDNVLNQ